MFAGCKDLWPRVNDGGEGGTQRAPLTAFTAMHRRSIEPIRSAENRQQRDAFRVQRGPVRSAGVTLFVCNLYFNFRLRDGMSKTLLQHIFHIFIFFFSVESPEIRGGRANQPPRPCVRHAFQWLFIFFGSLFAEKTRGREIEWKNKYIRAETFPHSDVVCSQLHIWKVIYKVPQNTATIWDSFPNDKSSRAQ